MISLANEKIETTEQEEFLYKELDKGIEDMTQGRTVPHEEAMQLIRERIKAYGV